MGLLQDKTIIVTGAGRGVGKYIALMAAAEGANVVVNDLGAGVSDQKADTGPAEEVASEIRAAGGRAIADTHSVADWDQAHAIVENALDNFGQLDGIVNNAGLLRDGIFHKMTKEDWENVISVHLNGSFFVSRAAAAHFKMRATGSIVHMTSTSGLVGNLGQANYAAAKMGIAGLSRSISIDMARFGVRSNCVAPWAFTRMTGSIPEDNPLYQERVAMLDKLSHGQKVAPLAVALLADSANGITGQIFGARANELYCFSQPRPVHTAHESTGWTAQAIAETAFPQMQRSMTPADTSPSYFNWNPV
ncbi:SDR family NAD(P)-dependent oxidoreductase [uncultured Shimia sp.]|uniref:SDR family NAD(P)-dependent oxidoreductase n=1 Tax=uncultured Shimia sp. TaxID=573152 RepID=UPI0025EB5F16|nr:SDR family NAD(P)-dependent oxidoreductase [uncultured Shimia sp.]